MLLTKTNIGSANDSTRMAAIQSIVESNTFVIDNSTFPYTADKVFVNGHFYSDKPPLSFLIGVPIYFILYKLGITFSAYPRLTYYIITLLTVGLSISMMIVFFCKLLEEYDLTKRNRFLYASILFFGTLILPYSVTFNNQGLAASLLFISYYFVRRSKKKSQLILAGALAGLAAAIEMVSGTIFVLIFALLAFFKHGLRKTLVFVLIASIPTIAHMLINYSISGSIIPFSHRADFWNYPGSGWPDGQVSGLVHQSLGNTDWLFNLTFGDNGFFLYSPVLIFSFVALAIAIVRIKKLRNDAILVGIGIICVFLFYLLRTNTDGCSYGFRYGVPLIPLLFSFTPLLLERNKSQFIKFLKIIFLFVAVVSVLFTLIGVTDPWVCETLTQYLKQPFADLLARISHNTISVCRI